MIAVVLIGHGSPATDCPPRLIGELMSLEFSQPGGHSHSHSGHSQARAEELDNTIRNWPRKNGNDPYQAGLEKLAEALRPLLPTPLLAVGYNEFCRPTIAEAISSVVAKGATRVIVIPSMLTPGGVHSEIDIPRALEVVRKEHPGVVIDYAWPFHLSAVAGLLSDQVNRAIEAGASKSKGAAHA